MAIHYAKVKDGGVNEEMFASAYLHLFKRERESVCVFVKERCFVCVYIFIYTFVNVNVCVYIIHESILTRRFSKLLLASIS